LIIHGNVTTVIPNIALTDPFTVGYDIGLDGVHFIGDKEDIITFLTDIEGRTRTEWPNPGELADRLNRLGINIWFSTEGTAPTVSAPDFLDGDLLSAATGMIAAANSDLLPTGIPAGVPSRGVDFGLDGIASYRSANKPSILFSTEILYEGQITFTDGDVLEYGNGVIAHSNSGLIGCFEPRAQFLGLDALHTAPEPQQPDYWWEYLPLVIRRWMGQ
jgi:hypothetical protein